MGHVEDHVGMATIENSEHYAIRTVYSSRRSGLRPHAEFPVQESCPFCPGSAEVPHQYRVAVLPNRYPSFEPALPNHPDEDGEPAIAYGRQGVFLYSSNHTSRIDQIGWQSISELLQLLGRTAEE
jgi:galactose-1-phosphate uridylyltransferase